MILAPLLLGKLPEYPSFIETIIYQLNGLMIVFVVLGSLWLLLELIGAVFKQRDARQQKSKAAAPCAKPSGAVVAAAVIAPEVIAAVSAAVHMALAGRRYRVLSVAPWHAMPHDNAWAAEGRRDIFWSHKTR